MWKIEELGRAIWQDERLRWSFDLRGGSDGIALMDRCETSGELPCSAGPSVALEPVDQKFLPRVCEQFVRGDELHLVYPQGEGIYELRIALRPIKSTENRLILEATIAVQTDFLDTHPKIDLVASGRSTEFHWPGTAVRADGGSPPISVATGKHGSVSILLGPHDSPFTTDHSTATQLKLRLFGDFLEKGVIRKARPWIVVDSGSELPTVSELESLWCELCESPLPLTA